MDLSPWCSKGFFPQSQLSLQTLALAVSVQPLCAVACISICVHVKNTNTGSHTIVWTHENHTLTGMGGAALVVAVPY